jgi:hypothetical protein
MSLYWIVGEICYGLNGEQRQLWIEREEEEGANGGRGQTRHLGGGNGE